MPVCQWEANKEGGGKSQPGGFPDADPLKEEKQVKDQSDNEDRVYAASGVESRLAMLLELSLDDNKDRANWLAGWVGMSRVG